MIPGFLHSITALVSMVPAGLLALRPEGRRDAAFWGAVALAFFGPAMLGWGLVSAQWVTGLAPALWISIAATVLIYAACAAALRETWRILPLLAPYLILLGVIATIWQHAVGRPLPAEAPADWVGLHIGVGIGTYALLTLAAMAALAAFLQERALKRKHPTRLTRQLPSVADSEHLSTCLLGLSEAVLGIGLISGMIVEWNEYGRLLTWEHKTVLSTLAFGLIGLLLLAKRFWGMRGRGAARIVLLAYLLVTLAYPGVKFVSEVMLG